MSRMRSKLFGAGHTNAMGLYYGRKSVENWLNTIRQYDTLSEEAERELAEQIANGSRRAEEKLIKANLKLVVSVANTYGTIMPLEDMIQEGNIGLIIAAREFNPDLGIRFITYATMMIRKYILLGIVANSRLVALPANKQCTELSTSESLDVAAFNDDDCDATKGDMLSGDLDVNTDLDSLAADLARVMQKTLDERAIGIVCKVFGIGCEAMFLDQIGAEYEITKERARQILQESLKKMGASGKILALLQNYKG